MTDSCLFCRIAAGEVPAHIVHQDDRLIAFLDLHPIRPGHTLIVPRDHHTWFEDMPDDLAAAVMKASQRIARAQKRIYDVPRVAMFFTGIHVPHVHAHVVPMHDIHDVTSVAYLQDGFDRFSPPPQVPADQMAAAAGALASAVAEAENKRDR